MQSCYIQSKVLKNKLKNVNKGKYITMKKMKAYLLGSEVPGSCLQLLLLLEYLQFSLPASTLTSSSKPLSGYPTLDFAPVPMPLSVVPVHSTCSVHSGPGSRLG